MMTPRLKWKKSPLVAFLLAEFFYISSPVKKVCAQQSNGLVIILILLLRLHLEVKQVFCPRLGYSCLVA
jgi:hypothetical protein